MRWTLTADHILLLKILETTGLSIDTVKVAAAWPDTADGEQGPTPRAIKERIAKIRDLLKQAGIDLAGTSSSNKRGRVKKAGGSKATPGSKAPSSPRKNKRQAAAAEAKGQAGDNADDSAGLDELLDYPAEHTDEDFPVSSSHKDANESEDDI